jgi:hypothetical protein
MLVETAVTHPQGNYYIECRSMALKKTPWNDPMLITDRLSLLTPPCKLMQRGHTGQIPLTPHTVLRHGKDS